MAPTPYDVTTPSSDIDVSPRDLDALAPILRERLVEADQDTLMELLLPKARRTHAKADRELLVDILMQKAGSGYDAANGILVGLTLSQARRSGRLVEISPIRTAACGIVLDFNGDEDDESVGRNQSHLVETDGIDGLIKAATGLAGQGDAHNAVRILVAILEGVATAYPEVADDYEGEVSDLFEQISKPLAEAGLLREIPAEERNELGRRVGALRGILIDYSKTRDLLAAAHRALVAGWEDSDVVAVISGRAASWPTLTVMEDENRLAAYRIAALKDRPEIAGRIERAARLPVTEVASLMKDGRISEALAHARSTFTRCWEANTLWDVLVRKGMYAEAMEVADFGLDLPGPDSDDLERRGSDLAFAENVRRSSVNPDRAGVRLRAAAQAARLGGAHRDYEALKEVSGARWPSLREAFVRDILSLAPSVDIVRILMDEGEYAHATAVFDRGVSMEDADLKEMIRSVGPEEADWVVRTTVALADEIIALKRPNQYRAATAWLGKAVEALLSADRPDEASELVNDLMSRYGNRSKLGSLVDDIRTRVEDRIARMERAPGR